MATVTANDIECPADLADAVTVAPTNGKISAGQHQAPIKAGMEIMSVKKDIQRACLSFAFRSEFAAESPAGVLAGSVSATVASPGLTTEIASKWSARNSGSRPLSQLTDKAPVAHAAAAPPFEAAAAFFPAFLGGSFHAPPSQAGLLSIRREHFSSFLGFSSVMAVARVGNRC